MSKKDYPETIWETKEIENGRLMICQNSNPELSKYPQWGPESGICEEWSEVGSDTVASTCWRCASRSVKLPEQL